MDLSYFLSLKEKLTNLERDVARLEGSFQSLRERLQKEFKCKSLKEAKETLKKLKAEQEILERECQESEKAFETKWGDRL